MNDRVVKTATICLMCLSIFNAGTSVVFADEYTSETSQNRLVVSRSVAGSKKVTRLSSKDSRDSDNSENSETAKVPVSAGSEKVIRLGSVMQKSNDETAKKVKVVRKEETKPEEQDKDESKVISSSNLLSRFDDGALYNKSIGSVELPSLGIKCDVVFGVAQKDVDAKNRMVLMPCSGVPGEDGRSMVLMDHNYQTGDLIIGSGYGTELIVNSGEFTGKYVFEDMTRGYIELKTKNVPKDIWSRVPADYYQMGDDIVLYRDGDAILEKSWTKTPGKEQYLYFVTCCGPSEGMPGDRWVCRFKLQESEIVK